MADKKISDLTAASTVAGTDVVPVVQTAGGADDPKKATVTQVLAPHAGNTSNPHAVTKAQVGLGNVQNVDQTNADNLTSGTVADARIAATIARDSEVTAAVASEATARDAAIAAHEADTTNVHGIGDTSKLVAVDGSGKVPASVIPAVAISDVFSVASQAAMLALTAQTGDVAVRADTGERFILGGTGDPSLLANWITLGFPFDAVASVNGLTGAVVIPSDPVAGTAGLRTLGSGAQQAAAGNDARLSDTRTPTDNTVGTAKLVDDAVTYAKIQNVSATDKVLGRSTAGAGDVEEIALTAAGRALIDDADTAAQRATLGLGSVATQAASSVAITGGSITGVAPIGNAGLTGATAASRYVGATASGAPTTGTFAVGDYIIDQTGHVWICTAAGTPGTWADGSASGRELGYSEITSNVTTTGIGFANRVDATGLIVTATVGTRPIMLEFWSEIYNTVLNDGVKVYLVENAAGNANNTPILTQSAMYSAGVAAASIPFSVRVRLAPSAGSHTYKAMFTALTGGTATIVASSGQPAFITVTER